jgi:hypothetical protein
MRTTRLLGFLLVPLAVSGVVLACGGSDKKGFDVDVDDSGVGPLPPAFGDAGDAHACTGWQCKQQACSGGAETTVTGTVYAPNGKLALYNAIVYVPNTDPDPLPVGATCDTCGAVTGQPVVTALTGPDGTFTLHNAPVGTDVPLVIQIGKWRRQVTIPEVVACEENKLTDHELTRLPKNQSEGNMPHIALTTGGCDNLGCMLPKVGIDASEFGNINDGPSKAVHVFNGSGGQGPSGSQTAETLWSDKDKMMNYDMLILSCECSEALNSKGGGTSSPDFGAMTEYLNAGGRIFTTDFMYTWYRYSPDANLKNATNMRGGAPIGGSPIKIDTSFPKGQALADWLEFNGVPGGTVDPDVVFSNIISVDPAAAQEWGNSTAPNPGPRIFTVNMPAGVPVEEQCGKGVHIDAHINQTDSVDSSYPAGGCNTPLKPGENLLAFFFFDLASCIQDDTQPPAPPQVK